MNREKLNASIRDIPLPRRMMQRPINERGFPVPYFVARVNGEYDFRAFSGDAITACYRKRLCWLCGQPLGQYLAFVIGPMCSVNRVSSEPPSHLECAEYAVRACPFLSKPRMRRNEVDLPEHKPVAGISLDHNPGATLIWVTKSYKPFKANEGVLFEIGPPLECKWYCEGRDATRADIIASFDKGLPFLREVAAKQDGPEGSADLEKRVAVAMQLLPVE